MIMINPETIKERIQKALIEEFKNDGVSVSLRAGDGFSSIAMGTGVRVEAKPVSVPDKKLKSCKAFFKSRGKKLGVNPKVYYKCQLRYEGKLLTFVGLTKSQAILKLRKNEYYVIPHNIAKIAADSFAGRIGNHV